MRETNYVGQKFNRLLVIEKIKKNGRVYYTCKCDCGNKKTIAGCHLQSGHTKSCGCLQRESNKWGTRPKKLPIAVCDGYDVYRTTTKGAGYLRNYVNINGRKEELSRYLAGTYIRPLMKGEIVHHIDHNHLNDSINNLEILTRAAHIKLHKPALGYKFSEEQKKKLSDSHKGQTAWNTGVRGFKHTELAKSNMSKAQKGRIITWGAKIAESKTKVSKEQLLDFISKNKGTSLKQIKDYFGLKTHGPVLRYGGLRKLRMEVA